MALESEVIRVRESHYPSLTKTDPPAPCEGVEGPTDQRGPAASQQHCGSLPDPTPLREGGDQGPHKPVNP
ncbi:hypothetical protein VZT92_014119 [Zoarces viviparus]|uniref:Uncharacterized protein n=1 Tax=Zoarces viviparus TaxID=48416 RepID=A0AAW1EZ87_ZOAVI